MLVRARRMSAQTALAERSGALFLRADALRVVSNICMYLRDQFHTLGPTLAPRLFGKSVSAISELLMERCDAILQEAKDTGCERLTKKEAP